MTKVNNRKAPETGTWRLEGISKAVVVLLSILGLNKVYLINGAPRALRIASIVYTACLITCVGGLYLDLILHHSLSFDNTVECCSAVEYCCLVVFNVFKSKKSSVEFFQHIWKIDSEFKVAHGSLDKDRRVHWLSIAWLVQSITIAVVCVLLFKFYIEDDLILPFIVALVLSIVNDVQLLFFGHLMLMIRTRLQLVDQHLRKGLGQSDEVRGVRSQAAVRNRPELNTLELYQLHVKIYKCYEILQRHINIPVSIIIIGAFIFSHISAEWFLRAGDVHALLGESGSELQLDSFTNVLLAAGTLKTIAALLLPCVLSSASEAAATAVQHTLADLLTDVHLEKEERRRLKGFHRSCLERRVRYALCRVVPLDCTLLAQFVALSVSYIVIASQLLRLKVH